MKILIVEDEQSIASGMYEAMNNLNNEIKEVFVSSSAEQALRVAEQHRPEIVITDIVLPGMNGLEMVQAMDESGYRPKVLVMSGYSDFKYVRQSLKFGAVDYFLKPFDQNEFKDKVQSVIESIAADRGRRHKETEQLQTAKLGEHLIIKKFVLGLCTKSAPLQEQVLHRLKMWGLTWLYDLSLTIVTFGPIRRDKMMLDEGQLADYFELADRIGEDILNTEDTSLLLTSYNNDHILISALPEIHEILKRFQERVLAERNIELAFGVSERVESFGRISEAYDQSVSAYKIASLSNQAQTLHYSDAARENDAAASPEAICDAICHGAADQIRHITACWIDQQIKSRPSLNLSDLSQGCLKAISQVQLLLQEREDIRANPLSVALWEQLDQSRSKEEMAKTMSEYFEQIASRIHANQKNSIVERAKKMVDRNFSLSLQEVAEQLEVSSFWLSHLFKKEEGNNFIDYLTDVRMEEAKRLLRESNLKIYEIAEAVGYKDLQHFGKVFKRKTGLKPKEYKYGK